MGCRRRLSRLAASLALLSCWVACAAAQEAAPRNVIVMIGDGWGFHQLESASLYRHGELGREVYDSFPIRYGMTTWSESTRKAGGTYDPEKAWADPNWVRSDKEKTGPGATDSAAAATAMATGVKTLNGRIGVDSEGADLETLVERADRLGKATGVVTSVPLSHATPASFSAHDRSRGEYEALAKQMILDSPLDVILGAGHPEFDGRGRPVAEDKRDFKYVGGEDTWQALRAGTAGGEQPWKLIEDRAAFQNLATGEAPARVIGVPRIRDTLQSGRGGNPTVPFDIPLNDAIPTLAEMSRAALNVLDDDPDGFFLMIEGGAIDWAGHSNNAPRLVEEAVDFNQAIEAVCDWIAANGGWERNLLVVTADHETGYLTGDGLAPREPLVSAGVGKMPGMAFGSGSHTNQLVPFFANGAGSERFQAEAAPTPDPVRGPYVDNTSIAKVIFSLWP